MSMYDDSDRRPRANYTHERGSIIQRAASQPPALHTHTPSQSQTASSPHFVSSFRDGHSRDQSPSPWPPSRFAAAGAAVPSSSVSRAMSIGAPPPPTRSASFSAMSPNGGPGGGMSTSLRDRAFPSTFEDDEDDWLADQDHDGLDFPRFSARNLHLHDATRSRSQSLVAPGRLSLNTNGGPIGGANSSPWGHADSGQRPPRYGEISRPTRMASSPLVSSASNSIPIQIQRRSSAYGDLVGSASSQVDVSNMSPFVRNVDRALLEENAALRELWGSMHGHVPVGSNTGIPVEHWAAPGPPRVDILSVSFSQEPAVHCRRLLISDDELASDLGRLNFNDLPNGSNGIRPPQSQPASLPMYGGGILGPHSPVERGGYVPMNLDRAPRAQQPHNGRHGGRLASVERRDLSRSPGASPAHADPASFRQQQQLDALGSVNGPLSGFNSHTPLQSQLSNPLPQQQLQTAQPHTLRYSQSTPGPASAVEPGLAELGRGVPLHAVPSDIPLFVVEFKARRQDVFYCADPQLGHELHAGDIVIVEADRGRDLGKIAAAHVSHAQVEALQMRQAAAMANGGGGSGGGEPTSPGAPPPSAGGIGSGKRDINPKRIYGKAAPSDTASMLQKSQDEAKALALCQSKIKQKKLPMEVVEAEYQWDRRKLTFYFIADKRIDFRELVRELFRLYKTRIWMASVPIAVYE
ncbi:PSP1 C-terminal conserved region-domain-containing protein [Auriculariales sp. MPI-PUGE-AT-0066]|nr:PSP1 C-terminal conserved region-domain-containing protein [Auriculariales sp. MPI-PUGE-AT-0066]